MGKKISKEELKKIQKNNNQKDKTSKSKKYAILISTAIIICIGVLIFILNSNKTPDKETYVTIAGTDFTQTDYSFYYCYTVNNYLSIYKDYVEYIGLDLEQPFSEQIYDAEKNITWFDFFSELTNAMMQTSETLYQESCKENYKPKNDIYNNFLEDIKNQAKDDNRSYENYLKNMFSETMTPTVFEKQLQRYCTSVEYSEYLKNKFNEEITSEQLEEYYIDNSKFYDTVNYHIFSISFTEEASEDNSVLTKEEAEIRANNVMAAKTEEEFHSLAVENATEKTKSFYEKENSTKSYATSITNDRSEAGKWLYEEDRKFGDTTIIEYNSSYYVLFFVDRYRNNDNTATFKHILLTTENYETEEKLKETATSMYELWVDQGSTEEMFTEYANLYSEDSVDDGLYENINKGTTLTDIDNWLFDESRQYGDSVLLGDEDEYHILFYIKKDEPKWMANARVDYANDKYNEYIDNIISNYQLNFVSGAKYNSADNNNNQTEEILENISE